MKVYFKKDTGIPFTKKDKASYFIFKGVNHDYENETANIVIHFWPSKDKALSKDKLRVCRNIILPVEEGDTNDSLIQKVINDTFRMNCGGETLDLKGAKIIE